MKKILILTVSIGLFFYFASDVYAAERGKQKDKLQETCQLISNSEAIRQAKAQTGGKIVSVQLNKNGRKSVYRVRVLVDEKRIKNISIKACK